MAEKCKAFELGPNKKSESQVGNAESFFFVSFFLNMEKQQRLIGQDSVCMVWQAHIHWSRPVQNTTGLPQ